MVQSRYNIKIQYFGCDNMECDMCNRVNLSATFLLIKSRFTSKYKGKKPTRVCQWCFTELMKQGKYYSQYWGQFLEALLKRKKVKKHNKNKAIKLSEVFVEV